jgi:hypothetical protein
MIHRDNSKEKQGEDKEEMMSHQMFHGSCLITHIRRRKREIKHTFLAATVWKHTYNFPTQKSFFLSKDLTQVINGVFGQ